MEAILAKRSLSSLKRVRQAAKRRIQNRQKKHRLRKLLKEIKGIKVNDEFLKLLPKVQKMVDKSVQKGIIHKNTAARIKSKLMKKTREK